MNKTSKIMSIVAVIAAATILVLPSILSNPVLASLGQSSGSTSGGTSSGGGSSSARNDYKNFQNCLSDAEGTKGYATEKEVRSCFNPIYNTDTSGSSSSTGGGNNDNSDSNSPRS
jgi:hypothetical protein